MLGPPTHILTTSSPTYSLLSNQLLRALAKAAGHKRVLAVSAASRESVPTLLNRLQTLVAEARLTFNPNPDPHPNPAPAPDYCL